MTISSRDKKFLIAGGIALSIFMLIKFIIFPIAHSIGSMKEEIELKESTLAKYRKIISSQDEIQKELRLLGQKEGVIRTKLFTGMTPSIVAADIQKIIRDIGDKSSIDIKRVRVMDPEDRDTLVAVPVRIQFYSNMKQMVSFIQKIENHNKLFSVSDLTVRVRNRRRPDGVRVTMVLCGYMKSASQV